MSDLVLSPMASWEMVVANTSFPQPKDKLVLHEAPKWLHLLHDQARAVEKDMWEF